MKGTFSFILIFAFQVHFNLLLELNTCTDSPSKCSGSKSFFNTTLNTCICGHDSLHMWGKKCQFGRQRYILYNFQSLVINDHLLLFSFAVFLVYQLGYIHRGCVNRSNLKHFEEINPLRVQSCQSVQYNSNVFSSVSYLVENCVCNTQKKPIKDQKKFHPNAFFKVFATSVRFHSDSLVKLHIFQIKRFLTHDQQKAFHEINPRIKIVFLRTILYSHSDVCTVKLPNFASPSKFRQVKFPQKTGLENDNMCFSQRECN